MTDTTKPHSHSSTSNNSDATISPWTQERRSIEPGQRQYADRGRQLQIGTAVVLAAMLTVSMAWGQNQLEKDEALFLSSPAGLDVYLLPASVPISNLLARLDSSKPIGKTPLTVNVPTGDFVVVYVREGFEGERKNFTCGFSPPGYRGWRIAGKDVEEGIYQKHRNEELLFARSNGAGREDAEYLRSPSVGAVEASLPLVEDGSDWLAVEFTKTKVIRVCRAYAVTKEALPFVHSAVLGTLQQVRDGVLAQLRGKGRVLSLSSQELSAVRDFFESNPDMVNATLDSLLETGAFFMPRGDRRWAGVQSRSLSPRGEYSFVIRFTKNHPRKPVVFHSCLNPEEAYWYVSEWYEPISKHYWPMGTCSALCFSPEANKLLWSIEKGKEVWCIDLAHRRVELVLCNWPGGSMLSSLRRADWANDHWLLELSSGRLVVWDTVKHETVYVAERSQGVAYSAPRRTLLELRGSNIVVSVDAANWCKATTNHIDLGFRIQDLRPRVAGEWASILGNDGQYALLNTRTLAVAGSGSLPSQNILDCCALTSGVRFLLRKDYKTVEVWDIKGSAPQRPVLVGSLLSDNVYDATIRGDALALKDDSECFRIVDSALKRVGSTDPIRTDVFALAYDGSKMACALKDETVRIVTLDSSAGNVLVGVPLPADPVSVVNGMTLNISPGVKSWFRQPIPSDKPIIARSVSGSFSLNGPTNIKAFYNEFKWKDARLWHDFILLPGDGATDGTALSFAYAFNVSADDAFRLEGTNSYSLQIGSVKPPSRKDLRPAFTQPLEGENLVRVRNPNDFAVAVGIRSGEKGKDFEVPAKGVNTVYVPNGRYDIYFVYSDKPDALFQGDSFTLVGKGVEIQIVKVVNGNYGIRQVK